MSNVWRRARALALRDWQVILEASVLLARAHAALRVQAPVRVLGNAVTMAQDSSRTGVESDEVTRIARLFGIASRRVVRVPCLSRSVALARMFTRRGVAVYIRIGVRTTDGRLEAHAWVEWNGRPLLEDEAALKTYAPFSEPIGNLPAARLMFR